MLVDVVDVGPMVDVELDPTLDEDAGVPVFSGYLMAPLEEQVPGLGAPK